MEMRYAVPDTRISPRAAEPWRPRRTRGRKAIVMKRLLCTAVVTAFLFVLATPAVAQDGGAVLDPNGLSVAQHSGDAGSGIDPNDTCEN
jgi:hypothetical protein